MQVRHILARFNKFFNYFYKENRFNKKIRQQLSGSYSALDISFITQKNVSFAQKHSDSLFYKKFAFVHPRTMTGNSRTKEL